MPSLQAKLPDILCLKAERTVGNDKCVVYKGRTLQVPPQRHRCHYVRAKVMVHEYEDGAMAVFHGPGGWGATMRRGGCWTGPERPHEPFRRPPRLALLASSGGGTPKRTIHVLQNRTFYLLQTR